MMHKPEYADWSEEDILYEYEYGYSPKQIAARYQIPVKKVKEILKQKKEK